jgi:hypothetical protein
LAVENTVVIVIAFAVATAAADDATAAADDDTANLRLVYVSTDDAYRTRLKSV